MRKTPGRTKGGGSEEITFKQKVKRAQFKRDLQETFATPHGKRTLKHIMQICGYQGVSIVGDPTTGDVHDRGTLYNEARRNIYLELRAFIHSNILKDVEFNTMEPLEIEDL